MTKDLNIMGVLAMRDAVQLKRRAIEGAYKFPNLAMETYWRVQGGISTYADYARMTTELLEAVIQGAEKITSDEILDLCRFTGHRPRYLFSKRLSFYDMRKPKHYRKVRVIYRRAEQLAALHPEYNWLWRKHVPDFSGLVKSRLVSRARVNGILEYVNFVSRRPKLRPVRRAERKSPCGASDAARSIKKQTSIEVYHKRGIS